MLNKLIALTAILFGTATAYTQYEELNGFFRFPLQAGKQASLAGTFGELRGSHFHAGIDIRTNGAVNLPVEASASGYISRISVSQSGYGKALYIQHPNGYTTVYAHLNGFSNKIEAFLRKAQYQQKTFEIQLYPKANELPVSKGDLIALSGNTGGSQAPHLHFEIRNHKSEPINPLYAHFSELQDNIAPVFHHITLAPQTPQSLVNGENTIHFKKLNSSAQIIIKDTIYALGKIGLGIDVTDNNNGASNKNGIAKINVYANNTLIYQYHINRFAFTQSNFIKAHLEYPAYKAKKISAHRCYIKPYNPLHFYTHSDKGILNIKENEIVSIKIEAYDFYNNQAVCKYTIKGSKHAAKTNIESISNVNENGFFVPEKQYTAFRTDSLEIYFSTNSLFESMRLDFKHIGDTFDLRMNTSPLKERVTIGIKPTIPSSLKGKTSVYSYNGKNFYYEGGVWEGDFIRFKTKSFDQYICLTDSIAPVFSNPKTLANSFTIIVKDHLSGVASFQSTLNNNWILTEYYPNDNLLKILPQNASEKLSGELTITVLDKANNKQTYKTTLP